MKQYDFTFQNDIQIEGVEERVLDNICGEFDSYLKETEIKLIFGDDYKNFIIVLENGIKLDCEISWNEENEEWSAVVSVIDEEIVNELVILEVEKDQTKIRLKEQIRSIRYIIDNLEAKLDDNTSLYESDGLQSNGVYLDSLLSKLIVYTKSIATFKKYIDKEKK